MRASYTPGELDSLGTCRAICDKCGFKKCALRAKIQQFGMPVLPQKEVRIASELPSRKGFEPLHLITSFKI
jgi:hypothetical protein